MLASDGVAFARYLPKFRRQRGYAFLSALASRYGISVQVSALTNPDFVQSRLATAEPAQGWLRFPKIAASR
jgi:hypothetical protein